MKTGMDAPFKDAENAALFQVLINTAVDGIIVIDAVGNVRLYNKACERLLGYAPEEVLGRNINMLMPSPYREQHDNYIEAYRTTSERKIIGIGREVLGQNKDGSTFPMYLSVGEGWLGNEQIFIGIIHDTTERQVVASRLQEVQAELAHVSRLNEMGQMTSALAHELNQPLTAIMNYLRAAQRTVAAFDDPAIVRAQGMMDKAAGQTARAGEIIRRLRDFVEKRDARQSHEDLNKTIEEAISLALVGASDANIKAVLKFDQNIPPVLMDRIQIQQVVLNLVRNAVEALQEVSIRELTIETGFEENGYAYASFSDTGPGLPDEVASRLFQPFVTTKEKGMGVGLSICQSIVSGHGGLLSATANENGGTTFCFRLPVIDA
ncbi:MAG: PAS domain S-box protein [Parvibaculum sp.]|uniref:PAS domain-containing sensor histidine kinase n=1 Tax=Parvibaculum sp. TaxID=2024848 RepID=UPI002725F171|nr:PAS domain S-box protein [Parvibaculum sp.]MDO8840492.1 PAS domain S-box protein [Parvibaculum sp.]